MLLRSVDSCSELVRLTWSDGSESRFHHAWLRDHCPQSLHPVSGQREFALRELPARPAPETAAIDERGHSLELRWPPTANGPAHNSTFDAAWLWNHRYDYSPAEGTRAAPAAVAASMAASDAGATLWRPSDLADFGGNDPACSWHGLQQVGTDGDAAALS